ncbi:hypothetical protein PIB30_030999 [Stylosanthes scabra]|uniref:Uncharacterized protein n=1 Tax=Stylosanthes scabra TaxID=79078 RepID=A0ABU6VAL8_9FABA|nr:hypothetical protein [Stylosanthes scabra]
MCLDARWRDENRVYALSLASRSRAPPHPILCKNQLNRSPIALLPAVPVGHELMRRLTARNPTLSDTLLTRYGFPIVSVRAALLMWLRNHQSVTYARKRETVITVCGVSRNNLRGKIPNSIISPYSVQAGRKHRPR